MVKKVFQLLWPSLLFIVWGRAHFVQRLLLGFRKKIEIISMYSICLDMYALRLLAAVYGGTPEFPIRWGCWTGEFLHCSILKQSETSSIISSFYVDSPVTEGRGGRCAISAHCCLDNFVRSIFTRSWYFRKKCMIGYLSVL